MGGTEEDALAIAEGTYDISKCDDVPDPGQQGACKDVVQKCKTHNCNTVSMWKKPSCHGDPVGGNPDYFYCMWYTCSGVPPLDGHCDEKVGCQGTFYTLQSDTASLLARNT